MEEDIRRLEEDLRRKMQDLKVAHTRLETRTYRPSMELCRDQVPTSPGVPCQDGASCGSEKRDCTSETIPEGLGDGSYSHIAKQGKKRHSRARRGRRKPRPL